MPRRKREPTSRDLRISQGLARLSARRKALYSDERFIVETERVRRTLESAYASDPEAVGTFFRRFPVPNGLVLPPVFLFLRGLRDAGVRHALREYVDYSNRFRVRFRLTRRGRRFEMQVLPPYGSKFHVRLAGDHLEPVGGAVPPDFPYVDYFESADLAVQKEIQELIDSGDAKFVQIDDRSDYSVRKDLESFAYHDGGITVVLHSAEQPYLLCVFGEKVTKEVLHRFGKALSAFQREHYARGKGGRPADLERLKKALKLDRQPGQSKLKAIDLSEGGEKGTSQQSKTAENYLSSIRSKLKKRNS